MTERFLLDIDGEAVGTLRSFHGLDAEAEIGARGFGPHDMPKKHVTNVRWTPGVATFGSEMGRGMYGWITEALDQGAATRSGSVAIAGSRGAAASSLAFSGAQISAIGFPQLDASDKAPASMTVEFAARQVRWGEEGATLPARSEGKGSEWRCSNFRVKIGELPCERVATVRAFTWTRSPDGAVTVPDVRLAISRADYPPWEAAAQRWFIDGEHRDQHEMTGRITLLSDDLAEELATIELRNVGFRKFCREDSGGGGDETSRFAVDFYVEKIGFAVAALA